MQGKLKLLTVESVGERQRSCTSFATPSLKLQSWPNNHPRSAAPPSLGFSQGGFRLTDQAPVGMFPMSTVSNRPAGRTITAFRFLDVALYTSTGTIAPLSIICIYPIVL